MVGKLYWPAFNGTLGGAKSVAGRFFVYLDVTAVTEIVEILFAVVDLPPPGHPIRGWHHLGTGRGDEILLEVHPTEQLVVVVLVRAGDARQQVGLLIRVTRVLEQDSVLPRPV